MSLIVLKKAGNCASFLNIKSKLNLNTTAMSMKTIAVILLALVSYYGYSQPGQHTYADNKNPIEKFDYFIGKWLLGEDGYMQFTWGPNKYVVNVSEWRRIEGKWEQESAGMIGWKHIENKMIFNEFVNPDYNGMKVMNQGEYNFIDTVMVRQYTTWDARDGTTLTYLESYAPINKDSLMMKTEYWDFEVGLWKKYGNPHVVSRIKQ